MISDSEAASLYYDSDYIKFLGILRIITSSLGCGLLCTMEFYRNKFVAHKSLKLLMTWHAFWTLVYCVSILVDNVLTAVAHHAAKAPDDILLSTIQCLMRRLPDALALYGSVSSMLAIALERRAASINFATYERAGASGGHVYALFHLALVAIFGCVMAFTYSYPSLTPHCAVVTPRGMPFINVVNTCLFSMEIATIILFAKLLRRNKRILNTAKFEIALTEKYQLSENIRMLTLFFPVVVSHTSITVCGLASYFIYQLFQLGPEYYPMFEDTINFVYMQGVFMPIIFLFRYRKDRNREQWLFSTNRATGDAFVNRYTDAIQRGW